MNNLNLTLSIIENGTTIQKTYYTITAISRSPKGCIIHTPGQQDLCTLSFEELWDKLNRINNESTPR